MHSRDPRSVPLFAVLFAVPFAPLALSGCLLEPNLLFDPLPEASSTGTDPAGDTPATPTEGGMEPDTGTSTSMPTTDASTGSTGAPGSSGTGDGSSGELTTGGPGLACMFNPPGVEVSVSVSTGGATEDKTLRPCGTAETWSPMLSDSFDGAAHHFQRCADDLCADCDPMDRLDLGLAVPDPFNGLAAHLAEGSCARVQVTWDRSVPGDDMLCRPSQVALIELREGALEPVPALLYRHTVSLAASDKIGDFELAAASAGPGAVECDCAGDCCGEQPGSRKVDFTIAMAGDATEIPTLDSQDSVQDIALVAVEGKPEIGDLALVRAYLPDACAEPAQYEWLFGRTTAP